MRRRAHATMPRPPRFRTTRRRPAPEPVSRSVFGPSAGLYASTMSAVLLHGQEITALITCITGADVSRAAFGRLPTGTDRCNGCDEIRFGGARAVFSRHGRLGRLFTCGHRWTTWPAVSLRMIHDDSQRTRKAMDIVHQRRSLPLPSRFTQAGRIVSKAAKPISPLEGTQCREYVER